MKSDMSALALGLAAVSSTTLPTVHMPLNFRYGPNEKVSTQLKAPGSDIPVDVCYDLGSDNFFIMRPDAIQNWGCRGLLCQGPCNATVPASKSYDPSKSSSASALGPWKVMYGYGGGVSKAYFSDAVVNDTFTFGNDAGYSTSVPDVQVALSNYLQQRLGDPSGGQCTPIPEYDASIMGLSPFVVSYNLTAVAPTEGPSFRQNLLETGQVSNRVQSLWFEKAPEAINGTYTGSGLQGGLDMSKFSGPLVKVPSFNATAIAYSTVGYYTLPPNVTFASSPASNGSGSDTPIPIDWESVGHDTMCMIDSGSTSDGIAPLNQTQFLEVTGLKYNPSRPNPGQILSWPGPCSSIPTDAEVPFLKYTFFSASADPAAAADSEKLEISMPLRSYARGQLPEDDAMGWCTIRIYLGRCMLGAPFSTRSFFAVDDETLDLALAKGGVAPIGSGVDYSKVVARIP